MSEREDVRKSGMWHLGVGAISRLLKERRHEDVSGGPSEVKNEAVSEEGCLKVKAGEALEFFSLANPARMFAVKANLAGVLGYYSKAVQSGRCTTVTVPVKTADGKSFKIVSRLTIPNSFVKGSETKLIKAAQSVNPQSQRSLDFTFSSKSGDLRYSIEFDSSLEVFGFKETADNRPVFQKVPPVAQMSAFLRAVTHRRRTVLNILDSLKHAASPSALSCIEVLEGRENSESIFDDALVSGMKDVIKAGGKVISEQVITAFSIFADMEAGALTPDKLRTEENIRFSPSAAQIVLRHFGADSSLEAVCGLFADVSAEEIKKELDSADYNAIGLKFKGQCDNRTPVQILEQISRESSSQKSLAFAEKLKAFLGGQSLAINDQQLGLLAGLAAVGRKYHANTVLALSLFVDSEVGYISEEALDKLSAEGGTIDTSTYAMLAVAGAFDVPFRALVIESDEKNPIEVSFPALVALSDVGLLGGFSRKGSTGKSWHWIGSALAASKSLRSSSREFSRNILGAFPIIDQLGELDLVNLLESGRDFIAAFQSDLDKSVLWRRISDISESEYRSPAPEGQMRSSYSFVEGFSAYHFCKAVIGRIETVEISDLIGRENVLAVFMDNRENRHYRAIAKVEDESSLEPPENTGWVWNGQVVAELDVSSLPGRIRELTQDALLGRTEEQPKELLTLSQLCRALDEIFTKKTDYSSLSQRPDIIGDIYEKMWSPEWAEKLAYYLDEQTRFIIGEALRAAKNIDYRFYAPMLEGRGSAEELEAMGIQLILALSASPILSFDGYYKHVEEDGLRQLFFDKMIGMAAGEDKKTRIMALRLLAADGVIPKASSRIVVDYALNTAFEDEDREIADAACDSMVRLCLSDIVPLPKMILLREIAIEEEPDAALIEEEPEVLESIPGLAVDKVRDMEWQIESWTADVKDADPRRYAKLPFVDSGNLDRTRLRTMAELLASLNQASLDEEGSLPRRYFALVSEENLEKVQAAALESWRLLAAARNKRLSALVQEEKPNDLFLDHLFFVKDNDADIRSELGVAPYLGGEEEPLEVFYFRPDEPVAPYRIKERSFVQTIKEESKFFLKLVSMYFDDSGRDARIVRLSGAGGVKMEELETFLPSFQLVRRAELQNVTVFLPHRIRFVPSVHSMTYSPDQIGSDPGDAEDVRALLCLFAGKRYVPKFSDDEEEVTLQAEESFFAPAEDTDAKPEAVQADSHNESPANDESADNKSDNDSDIERISELASRIGKALSLPASAERSIVNILMPVSRRSIYDL